MTPQQSDELRTALLFVLTCFACYALWNLAGAAKSVDATAVELRKDAGGVTSQLSTTLAQVNATELGASKQFALEQQELTKTLAALKNIVQRTDEQLFGRDLKSGLFSEAHALLVHSDQLVVNTDAEIKAAADSIVASSGGLSADLAALRPSLDELAATLADPSIRESLKNLDAASAGLAVDTVELQKMLTSGAATAEDVRRVADKVADEYTKTRSLAYALFRELLSISSEGVQFFIKK